MTETFEIQASRMQIILLAIAYTVAAVIAAIYIADLIPKIGTSMLCFLLGLSECQRLHRQQTILLQLIPADHSIMLKQGGQSYFYHKYKVYPARWFAILRLIDESQSRTLFLNSDRFQSVQDYRVMRYSLIQMERVTDAA